MSFNFIFKLTSLFSREIVANVRFNDVIRRSSPTQIAGATNWANIQNSTYPDSNETLATRTDGTLWSWGSNNVGQLIGNLHVMKLVSNAKI